MGGEDGGSDPGSGSSRSQGMRARRLVVDANALIGGLSTGSGVLERLCDEAWTVAEVVREVRDRASREALDRMTMDLRVREPDEASLRRVAAFARLTGDFPNLSRPDLRILALTLQLHVEEHGADGIRDAPKQMGQGKGAGKGKGKATFEGSDSVREALPSDGAEPSSASSSAREVGDEGGASASPGLGEDDADGGGWEVAGKGKGWGRLAKPVEKKREALPGWGAEPDVEWVGDDGIAEDVPVDGADALAGRLEETMTLEGVTEEAEEDEAVAGQSFGGENGGGDGSDGWEEVPPAKGKARQYGTGAGKGKDKGAAGGGGGGRGEVTKHPVACLTHDFAMQNVLLQMGLKLMSVDGRRIRHTSTSALKCEACFHLIRGVERKVFCPQCGNAYLYRVGVRVNRDGSVTTFEGGNLEQRHKKRYAGLRGAKYSVPTPRGGRYNTDIVLREDQVPKRAMTRRSDRAPGSATAAAFNPEYNDETWFAANKFNEAFKRNTQYGHGKKNPNERRLRKV